MSVVSLFVGLVASASLGAGAVAGVARLDSGATTRHSDAGVDVGAQSGADFRAQSSERVASEPVEVITVTTADGLDHGAEVVSHVESLPDAASQLRSAGSASASGTASFDSTGAPTPPGTTAGETDAVGAEVAPVAVNATAEAGVSGGLGLGG